MKKLINITLGLAIFASVGFATSCGKALSCVSLVSNISNASFAYAADESTVNCKALAEAMQEWVDNDKCSGIDATTKQAYINEIAELKIECP